jgi:hypothetical protein
MNTLAYFSVATNNTGYKVIKRAQSYITILTIMNGF